MSICDLCWDKSSYLALNDSNCLNKSLFSLTNSVSSSAARADCVLVASVNPLVLSSFTVSNNAIYNSGTDLVTDLLLRQVS